MKKKILRGVGGVMGAALLVAACTSEQQATEGTEVANGIVTDLERAETVVNSQTRFSEDGANDDMRKPAQVLEFIGVKPGATVFEIEAGTGYYTDLLSELVGDDGVVIMQNPASFQAFYEETVSRRLADGRLGNVRVSKSLFDNLEAETASVDIVTWLLGPHELYFTPSDGDSLGDVSAAYSEIFRILKPGGQFIILDHSAEAGAPETTGSSLHRIDPEIVKSLAQSAGFEFVAEADILRNPDDHLDMSVFDPIVRRMTDRFLFKYQKPENDAAG